MAADIGAIGGGISDIFGGIGELKAAKAYKQAAKYAHQNAIISKEAGDIKLSQTERAIFKTIGAQKAGYAAAGLASSGSAQSILRDSVMQGALEKGIVNAQTQINVLGYLSQEAQFKGMAAAAKAGGIGGIIGGAIAIGGALAFSDIRLKSNITRIGEEGGFDIYEYDINGKRERGPMAYDVGLRAPYALGPVVGGYATVNYDKLGLSHLREDA